MPIMLMRDCTACLAQRYFAKLKPLQSTDSAPTVTSQFGPYESSEPCGRGCAIAARSLRGRLQANRQFVLLLTDLDTDRVASRTAGAVQGGQPQLYRRRRET